MVLPFVVEAFVICDRQTSDECCPDQGRHVVDMWVASSAVFEKWAVILSFVLDNYSINFLFFSVTVTSHPPYLWAMVTTDDRAEHMMDQKRQSLSDPPGPPLVGQISDGS